jgi:hypothetical protein
VDLKELYQEYKVKKLAFEQAKKEEEKYKKLLKDAMAKAGEKAYTDEAGYLFERITQQRKSLDEERLLGELHSRKLEDCISFKEVVDEDATMAAVEDGRLPQGVVAECLKVQEVVVLKLTAPQKGAKK